MIRLIKTPAKTLLALLILFLPTQLGYHFWPSWSYIFGIRVDYLSPTIYLTDIIVFFLAAWWLAKELPVYPKKQKVIFVKIALAFFGFAAANIIFSLNPLVALLKWVKVAEFLLLGLIIATLPKLDCKNWVPSVVGISVLIFSAIGILQVIIGKTIGGPLYLLGERTFTGLTPGIALADLFGKSFLRAYSTFSHPNSLAGFLGVALFLLLVTETKNVLAQRIKILAIGSGFICFLFTFSLGAFIALGLSLFIYFLCKGKVFGKTLAKAIVLILVTASFILPIVSRLYLAGEGSLPENLSKRLALSEISGKMFSKKPFFGVGLNNFFVQLPKESDYPQVSWWLQPVHNIFLLVLAETGMLGLLFFSFILLAALNHLLKTENWKLIIPILFILFTGVVDHYWLTLQQNQIIFSVLLGLSFRKSD